MYQILLPITMSMKGPSIQEPRKTKIREKYTHVTPQLLTTLPPISLLLWDDGSQIGFSAGHPSIPCCCCFCLAQWVVGLLRVSCRRLKVAPLNSVGHLSILYCCFFHLPFLSELWFWSELGEIDSTPLFDTLSPSGPWKEWCILFPYRAPVLGVCRAPSSAVLYRMVGHGHTPSGSLTISYFVPIQSCTSVECVSMTPYTN